MNGSEDASLLRTYVEQRSQDAFSALVERHLNGVYSAAARRVGGDVHLAEDVTQQVFAALAQNAHKVCLHPVLVAWLFTTTRNIAAQCVRTERRRRSREAARDGTSEQVSKPDDPDWAQIGPLLDDLIDELSEGDRRAVLLRFIDNRRYSEIGATLEISDDAARMRVDRALAKLRSSLVKRGIKSPSAALADLLFHQMVAGAPAALTAKLIAAGVFSSGSTSAYFAFMTITKVTSWTAVVIAVLAMGTALHMSRVTDAAEEASAIAEKERDLARAQFLALQQKVARDSASVEESGAMATKSSGGSASANPSIATAKKLNLVAIGTDTSNPLAALWGMRSSPPAMHAWVEAQRSGLQLQLGPLFKKLNLSASDIERFKAVMITKFQAIADIAEAAASQGLETSNPGVRSMLGEASRSAESSLHSLVGDAGYQHIREYGETLALREMVTSLAGHAHVSDTPLTAVQSERLVQIIASETTKQSSSYDLQTTNWDNVFEKSHGVLTSQQIELLRGERDQVNLRSQLTEIERQQERDTSKSKPSITSTN